MIWIILLFIFICISSLFYPELRKLAAALLTTVAVIALALGALIAIFHH